MTEPTTKLFGTTRMTGPITKITTSAAIAQLDQRVAALENPDARLTAAKVELDKYVDGKMRAGMKYVDAMRLAPKECGAAFNVVWPTSGVLKGGR